MLLGGPLKLRGSLHQDKRRLLVAFFQPGPRFDCKPADFDLGREVLFAGFVGLCFELCQMGNRAKRTLCVTASGCSRGLERTGSLPPATGTDPRDMVVGVRSGSEAAVDQSRRSRANRALMASQVERANE